MKIGNIELKKGLLLGPMAGVTDRVYRQLCQEQGCELTFTEMVSAKAISYGNQKSKLILEIGQDEEQVGVQLFGNDPYILSEMAKRIDHDGIYCFDVNMGCPVPKVVNNGEGSALMKDPKKIGAIVKALVNAVDKPISIKIRSGFSPEQINAVEVCKIAEAEGASMVTIHGRTREQYYSGKANWDVIAQAKASVSIPIIGNGDVVDGDSLKAMLEHTKCDGVMVGRAAMGNPWIFAELSAAIDGSTYIPPTIDAVIQMIQRHSQMLIEYKGEYIAMREMRKHIAWYTKGLKNATKIRAGINRVESIADVHEILEQLKNA